MDVYKHFAAGLRTVTFKSAYLVVVKANLSSKLLKYVRFLNAIPFEDGKYHTYFGEVQRLADSFGTFWKESMDDAYKECDTFNSSMDKRTLLFLIDNTMKIRRQLWQDFEEVIQPAETSEQQKIYNEVREKYEMHMNELQEMKTRGQRMENQQRVEAFAREELSKSLRRTNEMFLYAQTYISMLLADHLAEIRGSLQDILQRLRNSMVDLQVTSREESLVLLNQIYDLEKELMLSNREVLCQRRSTLNNATLNSSITKIRDRVVAYNNRTAMEQLQEEEKYFGDKLKEFGQIESTLIRLKMELEIIQKERAAFQVMKAELPGGAKFECWQNMEKKYGQRLEFVKENLFEAARSLFAFFCSIGPSRILRTDHLGPFYIDDFGHQVYSFELGLKTCHVDCKGNLKEVKEEDRYFYDSNGRYIYENGQKIYRLMDCTSSHQLGEDCLLKKITADCGHSEKQNDYCGMKIKDLIPHEMLPKTEHVNITGTLDAEAVRYLWGGLGAVLPDALCDVGTLRPRNPIHYLAHRLLAHRYGKTATELRQKQQEAEVHLARVLQDRKKPVAKYKEWKAKQAPQSKRRNMEDSQETTQYNLYGATTALISSLMDN